MDELKKWGVTLESLTVTGVAIGLPTLGMGLPFCDQSHFERILNGDNFIQQLEQGQLQDILDQNVPVLQKGGEKRSFSRLTDIGKVPHVAGFADIDALNLQADYGVPSFVVETLDPAYQMALAAGIEAVRQSGITMPDTQQLREEYQSTTGVIFACSFPTTDTLVEEVSRAMEAKYRNTPRDQLLEMLAEHMARLSPPDTDKAELLAELQTSIASKQNEDVVEYEFNRKLIFRLLVMANSQLAALIKAKGPSMQVNTACSSTTQAVALAEDWIRLGRCERVIVLASDCPTSPTLMKWLGAGFMAIGATSSAPTVEEAAVPFDIRRSGLVLGSGAAALVLETISSAEARGKVPLCNLLGTHQANSAYHATMLDAKHIALELASFLDKMTQRYGYTRAQIAASCAYMAHETFTCSQGGCAKVETDALRGAFGDEDFSKIVVCNTKGFTGHAMAAGYEDPMSAWILHTGRIPPIANIKDVDPCLGPINLSKGGVLNPRFVLRFAAGFGSHFVYALYEKCGV